MTAQKLSNLPKKSGFRWGFYAKPALLATTSGVRGSNHTADLGISFSPKWKDLTSQASSSSRVARLDTSSAMFAPLTITVT
jgi:hypothetical protein